MYLGPPLYVVYNIGTNFASKEFYNNTRVINIKVKEVPIKAYNSIGLVKRYYIPLY
jgi:hypothetical protein